MAEKQRLVLEKAPLQGLVAETTSLVLEMAPLQGLVAAILRLVLEMAPLQGLEIEKWEMRYLFTPIMMLTVRSCMTIIWLIVKPSMKKVT
ncbi:MAG: hypothetical protein E7112_05995 [Bacteroidales bacterium]|nr:hypothetical protein [Bacteroidales bacterium]